MLPTRLGYSETHPLPEYVRRGLARRVERAWGIALDPDLITCDATLTEDHEAGIMLEYGPDAIVRYYSPADPRLEPLEGSLPSA